MTLTGADGTRRHYNFEPMAIDRAGADLAVGRHLLAYDAGGARGGERYAVVDIVAHAGTRPIRAADGALAAYAPAAGQPVFETRCVLGCMGLHELFGDDGTSARLLLWTAAIDAGGYAEAGAAGTVTGGTRLLAAAVRAVREGLVFGEALLLAAFPRFDGVVFARWPTLPADPAPALRLHRISKY